MQHRFVYTPYSKMAENKLFSCLSVNLPSWSRSHRGQLTFRQKGNDFVRHFKVHEPSDGTFTWFIRHSHVLNIKYIFFLRYNSGLTFAERNKDL